MRRFRDWISPGPNPLGGDGRWHPGHHLSGREPNTPRYSPIYNGRCHVGLDIAGIEGSPIVSPDDGVVETLGWSAGAGYYVTVRHKVRVGNGTLVVWSRHLHCLPEFPEVQGTLVEQGQPIALLGSTGSSLNPHNHTMLMLSPTLPDWHDLNMFIDPEPIYYRGRYAFMQPGHPYPNEVKRVQRRLNALGADPVLTVDGDYGPATTAAVKAFQTRKGLEPHGALSELSMALLFLDRLGKEA